MDQHEKPVWSWTFDFKDIHNKSLTMRITAPVYFLFDVIFMLITDLSDLSSTATLINAHQATLVVFLKKIQKSVNYSVHIYGLKTIATNSGQYDQVVCYVERNLTFSEEQFMLNVELKKYEEEIFPLSNQTQGTLRNRLSPSPISLYPGSQSHFFNYSGFIVIVKVKKQLMCSFLSHKRLYVNFPFQLPSAAVICCKIITANRQELKSGSYLMTETTSHSKLITFNTFLSQMDNIRLFNMAIQFNARKETSGLKPIKYFYRNKSVEYFKGIMNDLKGEMTPYLKSNGGDQGSILNGRLHGLFFSTYLEDHTNKPSPRSHYGPIRLNIEANVMFNSFCYLYFADFYCHHKRHHVTIVLTPVSSPCNRFCQQYLLSLNIYNNPYLCLRLDKNGSVNVFANMNVTVEVFYTETINVLTALSSNIGYIETTATIGRGSAPSSGPHVKYAT